MMASSDGEHPIVQNIIDDILRYEMHTEQLQEQLDLEDNNVEPDLEALMQSVQSANNNNTDSTLAQLPREAMVSSASRFVSVSMDETDAFLKENVNKNTASKTRSDVKIFYDWAHHNKEHRTVDEMSPEELDGVLARFFLGHGENNIFGCPFHGSVGVRKKDGAEYEPDTLSSIHNSIDRHLRDLKLTMAIKTDSAFSHSRRVLEAKRKSLKSLGKGNKPNRAQPLSKTEVDMLYQAGVLGNENADQLLNTIWINNGVYFGLRGRQEHTQLLWGDIELKRTSDGKEFLEFNERSSKTRNGAKRGDFRRVPPRMFGKPDDSRCPIKLFKAYERHRPEDMNIPEARFYLRPLHDPTSDVWFSHQPVGKQKLGTMLNTMAERAGLEGRKVNHSTRKTFGNTLVQAGVPPTQIAHLGGWKNIQTLNEYSAPSIEQQESTSAMLSSVMAGETDQEVENIHPHTVTVSKRTDKVQTHSMYNPFSILCGANITGSTVNINIVSHKKRKMSSTLESLQESDVGLL